MMCAFSIGVWLFQNNVACVVVLGERLRLAANLVFLHRLRKRREAACAGLERTAAAERVRFIRHAPARDGLTVHAIALVVVNLRERRVDRDLVKVRAAQPRDLRVDVGVDAPGQQRIVEKSRPGTMCAVQKATCSVSAKKLSGLRLSTIRPIGRTGTSSSGISLVASSTSKLNFSACSSVNDLHGRVRTPDRRRLRWLPTGRAGESPDPRQRS